jgi:hypothetical protein
MPGPVAAVVFADERQNGPLRPPASPEERMTRRGAAVVFPGEYSRRVSVADLLPFYGDDSDFHARFPGGLPAALANDAPWMMSGDTAPGWLA